MGRRLRWQIGMLVFVLLLPLTPVLAYTPNDAWFSDQWYLRQVQAPEAWERTTGSREVIVAVVDTGVDLDHPDLAANIWVNTGEIPDDGVDNDGNGFIDDVHGWDFIDEDNIPTPNAGEPYSEEAVAHGTAIAGVIGAIGDNNQGIAGFSWNVRLMPIRILDNTGSGTSADARRALSYAVMMGADIVNLSFTGTAFDGAFEADVRAAHDAGVLVVAAVGNADNGGIDVNEHPIYPACFSEEGGVDPVIGVAATTEEDTKAVFSNYGSDCVDLAAPGQAIYSTMYQDPNWDDFLDLYRGPWAGTSIAAPMVSGVAALLKGMYPSLRVDQIGLALKLGVDPLGTQTTGVGSLGTGRLNADQALAVAGELVAQAATTPQAMQDTETGITVDSHGHRVAPYTGETASSPVTGKQEALSVVASGWFIRSPSFDTVYFVDADLHRHAFWNAQTYFTWADTWADTVWVSDATLSTLPLGSPVLPKPGVVLVKIQSDVHVYAVQDNGELDPLLRRLPSESLATQLYGSAWADAVIDVEPTVFSHYLPGSDVTSQDAPDRTLLRTRADLAARIASSE